MKVVYRSERRMMGYGPKRSWLKVVESDHLYDEGSYDAGCV